MHLNSVYDVRFVALADGTISSDFNAKRTKQNKLTVGAESDSRRKTSGFRFMTQSDQSLIFPSSGEKNRRNKMPVVYCEA